MDENAWAPVEHWPRLALTQHINTCTNGAASVNLKVCHGEMICWHSRTTHRWMLYDRLYQHFIIVDLVAALKTTWCSTTDLFHHSNKRTTRWLCLPAPCLLIIWWNIYQIDSFTPSLSLDLLLTEPCLWIFEFPLLYYILHPSCPSTNELHHCENFVPSAGGKMCHEQ